MRSWGLVPARGGRARCRPGPDLIYLAKINKSLGNVKYPVGMGRTEHLREIDTALRRITSIGRSRDAGRLRAEVAGVSLTNMAAGILSALNALGPLRATALAEAVDTEAPLVSRELKTLQAQGYVEIVADPSDGRARVVSLTDTGRDVYRKFRTATDNITAHAFRSWDDADLIALRDLLGRVVSDFATTDRPSQ